MARINDIEQEPIFSPTYKDPERRALSLGILLSLPTLLGIVQSRAKLIKGGVFQSMAGFGSGAKAKSVLLKRIEALANTRQAALGEIGSSISEQLKANTDLINNLISDHSAAELHFGIAGGRPYKVTGPGSLLQQELFTGSATWDTAQHNLLIKSKDVAHAKYKTALSDWWFGNMQFTDKRGAYGQVRDSILSFQGNYLKHTPRKLEEYLVNVHDVVHRILLPRWQNGYAPGTSYDINLKGALIEKDIPIHKDLVQAANDLAEARRKLADFHGNYQWSGEQVHKRLIELAAQETKSQIGEGSGFGPWSKPSRFSAFDKGALNPEFMSMLKNDESYRLNFYKNLEALYNRVKGNTINLPPWATGVSSENPFILSDTMTAESTDFRNKLFPGRENYSFTNASVTELTEKLESRNTGLTKEQMKHVLSPERWGAYHDFHKKSFESIDPVFAEQVHGQRGKAQHLIAVRDSFQAEVNKIKRNVVDLLSMERTSGNPAYTAHIEALAEAAGMERNQYITFIEGLKIKAEIGADLSGRMPFKHAKIIIIRPGHTPIPLNIPLSEYGAFLPKANSKINTSPLFLDAFVQPTIQNLTSIDVAMMKKMQVNVSHYFRDLVQSGYQSSEKVQGLHKSYWGSFTSLVHTEVAGINQNFFRRQKVVSSTLDILRGAVKESGVGSRRWYAKFTAGWEALQEIQNISKRQSTILGLDFEFNASKTLGFDAIQGLVAKETTRPYQAAYQITRGSKKQLFNHWIRPDNWDNIRNNVKRFMIQQEGMGGMIEYSKLEAIMQGAQDPLSKGEAVVDFSIGFDEQEKNWRFFTDEQKIDKSIFKKGSIQSVRVHTEAGSFVEIAREIFRSPDGGIKFLTHGGEEADLILWNKRITGILEEIKRGRDFGISEGEIGLLKRLHKETSLTSLLARGASFDTHSMAMVVLAEEAGSTKFGLTDIFHKLLTLSVDTKLVTRDDVSNALKAIGGEIKEGKLTKAGKAALKEFPLTVRNSIKQHIQASPHVVKELLSMGLAGHHNPAFDNMITDFNSLLSVQHYQRTKIYNPELFTRWVQAYEVAKRITTGRSLSSFQAIDVVRQHEMFDPDRIKREGEFKLSLFGGTPASAAQAHGYLTGPETYLPFGRLANLQKQTQQVMSGRLLPTLDYTASKDVMIETAKPILGHRLLSTSQQFYAEEDARLGVSANRFGLQVAPSDRGAPGLTTRRTLSVLYLLGDNRIVGEDSGLWASKEAMKNAINFPRSAFEAVKVDIPTGLLSSTNLDKMNMSLYDFMQSIGISERVIEITKRKIGEDMSLRAFIEAHSQQGGVAKELYSSEEAIIREATEHFNKTGKDYIRPGDHIAIGKGPVNLQVEQTGQRLTTITRSPISNPFNSDALIKSITYDTEKNQFIFNLLGISRPSISKWTFQLKTAKPMLVGVANNTLVGKGIDLIVAMKKPDAAQTLNIQIRRVLQHMYRERLPIEVQVKRMKEVLMKSFNLDSAELDAMFTIRKSPILDASQRELYKSSFLATVELKDPTVAKLDSTNIYPKVAALLKEQGLTIRSMQKIFVEQHADVLQEIFTDLKLPEIKSELSSLYRKAINLHKESLNKWIKSNQHMNIAGHEGFHRFIAASKMREILGKGLAFHDMALLPNRSAMLDVLNKNKQLGQRQILKDVFTKITEHEVVNEMFFANAAFLVVDEGVLLEDLSDVSKYKGTLKNFYDTPTQKSGSFSLWEMLVRMEAVKGSKFANKYMIPEMISSMGWYNTNISSSLSVHSKFLDMLKEGYNAPSTITSDQIYTPGMAALGHDISIYRSSMLGVSELDELVKEGLFIKKDIEVLLSDSKLMLILKQQLGEAFVDSHEFQTRRESYISALRDRIQRGTGKGFLSGENLGKMNIFKTDKGVNYIKFGLPDIMAAIEKSESISPELKTRLRKTDLFRNEKSVFFSKLRVALEGVESNQMERSMLAKIDWLNVDKGFPNTALEDTLAKLEVALSDHDNPKKLRDLLVNLGELKASSASKLKDKNLWELANNYKQRVVSGREGRLAEVMFPHLKHEFPLPVGDQYLITDESAAKLKVASAIESYQTQIDKIVKDLEQEGRSLKSYEINDRLSEIQSSHEAFMRKLATGHISALKGLSSASWKSQRAYAPIMYAKAVDVGILLEQGLGGLLADIKDKNIKGMDINFFDKKIASPSNPIMEAIRSNKFRTLIKEALLYQGSDPTTGEAILSLVGEEEARNIQRLSSEIFKHSKDSVTWGEYLGNILGIEHKLGLSNKLLNNLSLYKEIGTTGYKHYFAKGFGIGEGIMSHSMFASFLEKGNPGALSMVRKPDLFRSVLAGKSPIREMFARAPLFENWFGARLRNVYLMPDKIFEQMHLDPRDTKRMVAVSALDIFLHGGDFDGDLANFMINNSSMYRREYFGKDAAWTGEVNDVQRVKQWLNFRVQQAGRGALTIQGQDYIGIEETADGRLLVRHDSKEKFDFTKKMEFLTEQMDDPMKNMSHAEKNRVYMVQQVLTPVFGQKAKMFHHSFLPTGGIDPAMKNEVVQRIQETIRKHYKDPKILQDLLTELGHLQDIKPLSHAELKLQASRYLDSITNAWERLQRESTIPLYEQVITQDGTKQNPKISTTVRPGTMKKSRFAMFFDWHNKAMIHGVPIEKAKAGQLNDWYNMTVQFSKLMSGDNLRDTKNIHRYFWDTSPFTELNLSTWFVNPGADHGIPEHKVLEIQGLAFMETQETFEDIMRLKQAERAVSKSSLLGGLKSAAYWTLSKNPRNAIYGAQVDLLSEQKNWIHSGLTSLLGVERAGMITDAESAAFFTMRSFEERMAGNRAGTESMINWLKQYMSEGKINKWGKRASVGVLAAILFDPNANSLLLPDLEVNGEKYDIPSFRELSKSYRNRLMKIRSTSPPVIDKLLRTFGLPNSVGARAVHGPPLPPRPNRVSYSYRERRDKILGIKEYARKVNGIMLGQ